jgi:hypothetical protein
VFWCFLFLRIFHLWVFVFSALCLCSLFFIWMFSFVFDLVLCGLIAICASV